MSVKSTDSSDLSSAPSDFEDITATTIVTSKRGSKRAAQSPSGEHSARKRVKTTETTPRKTKTKGVTSVRSEPGVEDRPTSPRSKAARGRKKKAEPKPDPSNALQDEFSGDQKIKPQTDALAKKALKRMPKSKTTATPAEISTSDAEIPSKKSPAHKSAPTTTPAAPDDPEPESQPKIKRKRKTAEEKAQEAMPLASRTTPPTLNLGAHVSASGGVHNAITAAVHIGGNALALFLKSQRKWVNPPLNPEHSTMFHAACSEHGYAAEKHVVPHGSYLVNLAAKDEAKKEQAYTSFLDDLKRCEELGIGLYNFHPGNTNGEPRSESISRLAARLNEAHAATAPSRVVTLLENMAARPEGNTLGATFADLRDVIALVRDKSRVGVCLDTCHAFAAGYDLRSPSAFAASMEDFQGTVGMQYLRALHINDSKAPFGSHRDLHANIGTGFLGLRAFHNIVNEPRLRGLPMVLETPIERKSGEVDSKGKAKTIEDRGVWAREIKLLESLIGMNAEGEEFKKLESELAERGRVERDKYQEQFERKEAERAKKKSGGGRRGKKKGPESESAEESNEGESE